MDISREKMSKALTVFFILYGAAFLTAAYLVPAMHDYRLYFNHWDLLLAGDDPWKKIPAANAYGPIYNLFAFPYALNIQFPKLLFVGAWLALVVYSVRDFILNTDASKTAKSLYTVFWLFNPFFIVCTVFYGFNDNLVALIVFVGLLVAFKGQEAKSTFILTLGILTKLYPLFLLPFVSKDWKDIRRNIWIFFGLLISAYLICYLVWGPSFAVPFGKANGRNPTLFSIMKFFHGQFFPFETVAQVIITSSRVLILGGIFLIFKRYQKGLIAQHTAFLAGFTVLLMFYKAGQQQFYITYFAVFAAWVFVEFKHKQPNLKAFYAVLVLGAWMMLIAGVLYPLTSLRGDYAWVRDIIGVPTFVILSTILACLIQCSSGNRKLVNA